MGISIGVREVVVSENLVCKLRRRLIHGDGQVLGGLECWCGRSWDAGLGDYIAAILYDVVASL